LLWLREVRGFSYPEIAALLRIPEGTVRAPSTAAASAPVFRHGGARQQP
jgi:DNA-directed RNA polymerase specialized sigma24 family protein